MRKNNDPASETPLPVAAQKILSGNDAKQFISERENTREFRANHDRLRSERMAREAEAKLK
jgi:hypothetical protein